MVDCAEAIVACADRATIQVDASARNAVNSMAVIRRDTYICLSPSASTEVPLRSICWGTTKDNSLSRGGSISFFIC